jgi:hypothetical protein
LSGGCGATLQCAGSIDPGPIAQGQDLARLKEQLRQALNNVEAAEKALDERLKPQTVEEVEDLQKKMQDALGALEERKAELQKQPKDSDKPSQG